MRTFHTFTYKDGNYRFCCPFPGIIQEEIRRQRTLLETYLTAHPAFLHSLTPVAPLTEAPEIARRMAAGSRKAGTGPMASIAGTIAQLSAEAAMQAGAEEAIIDNGGDLYLYSGNAVRVALFSGTASFSGKLALKIEPAYMPAAVCSSSSKMGHSKSFGDCDLATVIADDAALADAAATMACNCVQKKEDINRVLERTMSIRGIRGIIIIKDDRIGISGKIPEIVKIAKTITNDALRKKIIRDKNSVFLL